MDIQFIKGVGPRIKTILQRLGINSSEDFLYNFPRIYDDRRKIGTVSNLKIGDTQSCLGVIKRVEENKLKRRFSILRCTITDNNKSIVVVWFNQSFVKKQLVIGSKIYVRGKVEQSKFSGEIQLLVTEYEILTKMDEYNQSIGTILPIYMLTTGLTQKKMRQIAREILEKKAFSIKDPISQNLRKQLNIMSLKEAINNIHFPSTPQKLKQAETRLVFDDFFYLQLALGKKRLSIKSKNTAPPLNTDGDYTSQYLSALPYTLTKAQLKCIQDIQLDVETNISMNRLIQGDVGSGKTDVAAMALLFAIQSGMNGVIMAPTEILAEQHYLKFKKQLEPLGIEVLFLKGKMKASEKKKTQEALKIKESAIIVGTHALIQKNVDIKNIGIAVIDEQHRFGVIQRMKFRNANKNPHCLFMTATPIPRSYLLTTYGDLDKSIIDEMPPGRKPSQTYYGRETSLHKIYEKGREELQKGHQIYIVYPLVEESEKLDLKSAVEGWEYISKEVYPEYAVGLMHGQLAQKEKAAVMDSFKKNETRVLIATTVIEVGIDVPNATMMIIQHAERFGLAQLHQLRGRIGRGGTDSMCFLISDLKSEGAKKRIQSMRDTSDGFKIAEYDLKIRGPGDVMGTKQSGTPDFKLADIIQHEKILLTARAVATKILKADPNLTHPDNLQIEHKLATQYQTFYANQLN